MPKVNRAFALLSFVTLVGVGGAVMACGGSAESVPRTTETTNPETGLKVSATIASASLGSSSANVQLAFVATDATAPAAISVTSVALIDARSGNIVDTLDASSPSVWNGRSYETWNEKVTPGGDLRASYALSAPDWSALDDGNTTSSRAASYSTPFKLRITLRIDGSDVTIESGQLEREPEVVT